MEGTQPHQREPPRSALTIMLVDDDEDEREVMRRALARRVDRVVCCDGGLSALQELRDGAPPDVIVLDLRMPGMNGWQFRVAQKRVPAWASIPLIGDPSRGQRRMTATTLP